MHLLAFTFHGGSFKIKLYCQRGACPQKVFFPIFKETVSLSVNFTIEFVLKTDADSVLCRL